MSKKKYPKLPDLGTRTDEITIFAGPCSIESEEQFGLFGHRQCAEYRQTNWTSARAFALA